MSKKTKPKKSVKKETEPLYAYKFYFGDHELDTKKNHWITLKNYLPLALFVFTATALVASFLVNLSSSVIKPKTDRDMASTSVMITRPDKQSGGTGVILESTPSRSFVLTNSHVCGVVENGGVVITDSGNEHAVVNYVKSKDHDLCMIEVAADLHLSTKVANSAPEYYDSAAVSGHPALLPTVITRGHFSGRRIVPVFVGVKKCKEEDFKRDPMLCLFFGGIPMIKSYEAQVVTATIQGGSSGSAVYNSKGEISGLVFAGSGQIGYAFVVPYEAVFGFVDREFPLSSVEKPNTIIALYGADQTFNNRLESSVRFSMIHKCQTDPLVIKDDKIADACKILASDMIYNGRAAK